MKQEKLKVKKKGMSRRRMKRYIPLYLMILPGLIYLIINNYMPMAGLALAFKKVNYSIGLFQSPWCGLDNFKFLFSTNDAFIFFRNTILYNLGFIFLGNALGVFVAICLDSIYNKFFKKFSQVIILIPYLLSTVIISYIVFAFLSGNNGFMNLTILPMLGIDPVSWYNESQYWPYILMLVYLWMTFGYSSILYYSTLIGIDKSYYEAAAVDGAGVWAQIRHITLPALKPTIITLVLLAIGRICYSDFGLFYQIPMNSGLLYSTTQTIDTYVYRALIEQGNISMSSAAGVYQSLVGFAVVMVSNWVVRRADKEKALF